MGAPTASELAVRLRANVDLTISGDIEMIVLCHVLSRKSAVVEMEYGHSCRRRW